MSDPFDKYRQYDQDLRDAYAAGLEAAREAVAGLEHYHRQYDQDLRDAYAAGLDAAREAVSNVLSNGYHSIEAHKTVIEALVAIDAMRGAS